MLEEQRKAILEQNTYRKELDCRWKEFQENLEQDLKNINNRQDMIKSRQEMIFTKQDQIQSTLHGETRSIHSPSASVLADFSPPFTSATASVADFGASWKPGVHVTSQIETPDVSSILSESDLENLLSLDWITPLESQAGGPQTDGETSQVHARHGTVSPLVEATTTGTLQQPVFDMYHRTIGAGTPTATASTSHHSVGTLTALGAGPSHHETTTAGTSHLNVGTLTAHHKTTAAGTPHHETATAGTYTSRLHVGTLTALGAGIPHHETDTAGTSHFNAGTMTAHHDTRRMLVDWAGLLLQIFLGMMSLCSQHLTGTKVED